MIFLHYFLAIRRKNFGLFFCPYRATCYYLSSCFYLPQISQMAQIFLALQDFFARIFACEDKSVLICEIRGGFP